MQKLKEEYILKDKHLHALNIESTVRRFWSCVKIIMSELNASSQAFLSTSIILEMRLVSKEMKDCVSNFWLKPQIVLTPRGLQKASTRFFAAFRTLSIEHVQEDCPYERQWLKSILKIQDLHERNFHIKLRISSHFDLEDLVKLLDKYLRCSGTSSPGHPKTNLLKSLSIIFRGDHVLALNSFRELRELVQDLEIEMDGCKSSNQLLENLKSVHNLAVLATIRVLDLSDNGSFCGPDSTLEFRAVLTALPQLRTLKLSSANIHTLDITELARSITSVIGLTELELNGCDHRGTPSGFDSLGATELAPALARLTTIHTLDLEGNPVGDAGLFEIVSSIVAPASLKLDTSRVSAAGAGALGTVLRSKAGLTELHLNNSEAEDGSGGFGDAGATQLAAALVHLTALVRLQLAGNYVGDAGAAAVGSALTALTGLEALSLRENKIGVEGVQAIAHVLASTRLEVLDLSCNGLGNAGAVALAAVLSGPSLTELDISHNGIDDQCASALAQGLARLTLLDSLNLSGSDFGRAGVRLLAKSLPFLGALDTLSLDCIFLGDDGLASLAPALASLTALRELELGYNLLGPHAPSLILGSASSRTPRLGLLRSLSQQI